MVSSRERKKTPEYSLVRIHELAEAGEWAYGSRRVARHIENLGYSPDDVGACLVSLREAHYRGTVRYENAPVWLDEYLISFKGPSGHVDDLYIKLKLNRDGLLILLASFHPEGWI